MSDRARAYLKQAAVMLLAFLLFTVLIKILDVKPIGPEDSEVGFAALNGAVNKLLGGYHPLFETLTKLLGYLALAVVGFFACFGGYQLIKSRSLSGVDRQILVLGVFYVVVLVCYVLFEKIVINYRPVILEEGLEASYPSSHTVLVVAVMATLPSMALYYMPGMERPARLASAALIAVMVLGRLISGVHWFTDIIGGLLISAALVMLYFTALEIFVGDCGESAYDKKHRDYEDDFTDDEEKPARSVKRIRADFEDFDDFKERPARREEKSLDAYDEFDDYEDIAPRREKKSTGHSGDKHAGGGKKGSGGSRGGAHLAK